jgi:hypothetical protein
MCGIYIPYYVLLIFMDYLRDRKNPDADDDNVLTFAEDRRPVIVIPDTTPETDNSPVVSSGGVSLKQLFSLAQEEAIAYIKAVSF